MTQVIDKAKARIRMTDDTLLEIEFDRCAGAGFGAVGLSSFVLSIEGEACTASLPLLAWLLVSEALARNDDPTRTWEWVTDQIRSVTFSRPPLREVLHRHHSECWSATLPILFCGSEDSRQMLWDDYHRVFPTTDQRTVRTLLWRLFTRYGRNLFQPGHWGAEVKQESRFATPDRACIVKLGLTLKDLVENTEGEDHAVFEGWQRILKESVLHKLPARLARGFASSAPLFEDLVLAVLAVAEWLALPNGWRIVESVRDMEERADERLTPDQRVFAGALYGWIRGYQSVGNWIENPGQRGAVSRQAIRQAMMRVRTPEDCCDLVTQVVIHGSPSGSLSEILQPYVHLAELKHEEVHSMRADSAEVTVAVQDTALLEIAQRAFLLRISVIS